MGECAEQSRALWVCDRTVCAPRPPVVSPALLPAMLPRRHRALAAMCECVLHSQQQGNATDVLRRQRSRRERSHGAGARVNCCRALRERLQRRCAEMRREVRKQQHVERFAMSATRCQRHEKARNERARNEKARNEKTRSEKTWSEETPSEKARHEKCGT